jgi:hypothetical protein
MPRRQGPPSRDPQPDSELLEALRVDHWELGPGPHARRPKGPLPRYRRGPSNRRGPRLPRSRRPGRSPPQCPARQRVLASLAPPVMVRARAPPGAPRLHPVDRPAGASNQKADQLTATDPDADHTGRGAAGQMRHHDVLRPPATAAQVRTRRPYPPKLRLGPIAQQLRYTCLDHRLPPVVRAPGCYLHRWGVSTSAPFHSGATWGLDERRQEGSARVGPGKFLRRTTRRANAWRLHRKKFQGALALTSGGARLVPHRELARFALHGMQRNRRGQRLHGDGR